MLRFWRNKPIRKKQKSPPNKGRFFLCVEYAVFGSGKVVVSKTVGFGFVPVLAVYHISEFIRTVFGQIESAFESPVFLLAQFPGFGIPFVEITDHGCGLRFFGLDRKSHFTDRFRLCKLFLYRHNRFIFRIMKQRNYFSKHARRRCIRFTIIS